jgi:hypothetical protein
MYHLRGGSHQSAHTRRSVRGKHIGRCYHIRNLLLQAYACGGDDGRVQPTAACRLADVLDDILALLEIDKYSGAQDDAQLFLVCASVCGHPPKLEPD